MSVANEWQMGCEPKCVWLKTCFPSNCAYLPEMKESQYYLSTLKVPFNDHSTSILPLLLHTKALVLFGVEICSSKRLHSPGFLKKGSTGMWKLVWKSKVCMGLLGKLLKASSWEGRFSPFIFPAARSGALIITLDMLLLLSHFSCVQLCATP